MCLLSSTESKLRSLHLGFWRKKTVKLYKYILAFHSKTKTIFNLRLLEIIVDKNEKIGEDFEYFIEETGRF